MPLSPGDSPGFLLWHATLRWQRDIATALAPLDLTHGGAEARILGHGGVRRWCPGGRASGPGQRDDGPRGRGRGGLQPALEGRQHPVRDAQFRYINEQARGYMGAGQPLISGDEEEGTRRQPQERGVETFQASFRRPADRPQDVRVQRSVAGTKSARDG